MKIKNIYIYIYKLLTIMYLILFRIFNKQTKIKLEFELLIAEYW